MPMLHRFAAIVLFSLSLVGCGATSTLTPGEVYPAQANRLGALDIQFSVVSRTVTLTNTTASALPAGRLWLNSWYSSSTDALGVGQTLRIPITAFHDEHGEIIRGGGFFASEAAEDIVLAELQTDKGLSGLIVVKK